MKIKQAYEMFSELWRFYKKYATAPRDEQYYYNLVKEAERLQDRYKSELCKGILVCIAKEMLEQDNK